METFKFRDGWYIIKSIFLNNSNYGNENKSPKLFYEEEVRSFYYIILHYFVEFLVFFLIVYFKLT